MSDMVRITGGLVEGLSGAQEAALSALREGQSFASAAERAGVGRATVYRWVQGNPAFQAAYNTWQRELAESARSRLLKLTEKAVDVLEKALSRGDEQVALQMLRHTGVMRRRRARPTDVEVLDLQNQDKRRREHQRVAKGMLDHMLGNMGIPPKERRRIISGRDGGAFARRLEDCRAKAPEPADMSVRETPEPAVCPVPAEEAVATEAGSEPNPFQGQAISEDGSMPTLRLAGETTTETNAGASRDGQEDQKSQMVEGWRVGKQLYAVP